MSRQTRTPSSTLLALVLAPWPAMAGHVPPAVPVTIQAAAAPAVRRQDYLELDGNVLPAFASARQLGPVDAQEAMDSMILALKPAPGAEARLEQRLAGLQDPASPSYHQWLTPEQFGAEFGPAPEALERAVAWLQDSGFQVGEVAAGRLSITFSGTVDQVERAFRTPIRKFQVEGRLRQGNLRDPSIPSALADVVEGVVSLHNLRHPAMNRGFAPASLPAEAGSHNLTPGDFAAIYNLKPLYKEGIDGSGVAIAIVGRTRIPLDDLATFRKEFGLPARAPEIIINGPDPGDQGMDEDGEADLDAEWSGAVAPNATIRFVASDSTSATDGADLSSQFIVNHNLAPVMSLSFGECESQMGATERVFFRHLWAQAALQGISVMVSSGDSGPAGCNSGNDDTGSGPAVSGLASTPFNVAVGGTEFNEGPGTYWRAKPGPDQSSAMGYIPEKAWNESASAGGSGLWATGGGQSSYFPRPCWQVAKGVPCAAPYRCLPDVSLAAAGGHDGYVVETSGMRAVVGGTSCSSPAFAGIMALVVQKTGERQGNPCPTLYTLGNAQYKGTGPQVFHDITEGDSSVPGTKGYPCTLGYDLATGLGTVDAQALVGAWSGGTGNNVQANIRQPAADQALASGTQAAFQGTGQDSNPNAALTYAWNFGDGGSAQGAQAAHTYRNAGPNAATFLVTFTATDETGAQDTDTRNVVVLPPTAPGELILNGGFEAGTLGWTARNVSVGDNRPDGPAHSGKGSAWFSGWQNSLPEVLLQTVRIPAQAASARLSFWLRVQAYGDNPVSVDSFRVKAREADGRLAVLGAWSNLDDAPDYAQRTIDLGAYRGHTVQLSFVAEHNNDGVNTSFLLDDVSLIAQ